MAVVTILAAVALRAFQLSVGKPCSRPMPRMAAVAAVGLLSLLAAWMVWGRIGPALAEREWERFVIAQSARSAAKEPANAKDDNERQAETRHVAAVAAQKERIASLEWAVAWQPDHAEAHLELARCHLGMFDLQQMRAENAMSLPAVRDAAVASRFPTKEALERWLSAAVGPHAEHLKAAVHHARQAVALCPLEAEGYLFLGELCFLDGRGDAKQAYLDQALKVRPYDGRVLYTAGIEAWLAGDSARWLELTRKACACGVEHQDRVIRELLAHAPPDGIEAMIDLVMSELKPDLSGLRSLHAAADERGTPEQLSRLRKHYAQVASAEAQAQNGPRAARLWLEVQRIRRLLDDGEGALVCARNACVCAPDLFDARYGLALSLVELGKGREAEPHLQWCLQRRPDQPSLQKLFKDALEQRLDQSAQADVPKRY
jgi:tetratricopeptide (TPR) repeat protein